METLLVLLLSFMLVFAPVISANFPEHSPSSEDFVISEAPILSDEEFAALFPRAVGEFVIEEGVYTCPNDGSTLVVIPIEHGYQWAVQISLYRLTTQVGVGTYVDEVLSVYAEDAAGGIMHWRIKKDGNLIRAEVVSSEWSLLSEGTIFEFEAEESEI